MRPHWPRRILLACAIMCVLFATSLQPALLKPQLPPTESHEPAPPNAPPHYVPATIAQPITSSSNVTKAALLGTKMITPNNQAPTAPTPLHIESPHPYWDNIDQSWRVYGPPEATIICIYFSVIDVESGYDYVYVYDSADNLLQDYTGHQEGVWTNWYSGNFLRVRLLADYSNTGWGFAVSNMAVGASVSAESPHPYPNDYDQSWWVDGTPNDAFDEFVTHFPTILTEPGYDYLYTYGADGTLYDMWSGNWNGNWSSWASSPNMRIRLTSDSSITDYGFLADWSNEFRTSYVESPHNYGNSMDLTFYVYGPSQAANMRLHFARLNVEQGYDHVYVYDANGNTVEDYSPPQGDLYDFWTDWGNGNWMRVELVSDSSVTYWGFRIDQYDWQTGGNSVTFLTEPTFIGQSAGTPLKPSGCSGCSNSNSNAPIAKFGKHAFGWRSDMEHIPDSARAKPSLALTAVPPHLDWRNINGFDWTTPIRDQDGCGSCVAFGAMATFEAALKIASGNPNWNLNLSEQQIFSCGGGDCTYGWNIEPALNYLKDYGASYEECFSYQAIQGHCDWTCSDWQLQAHKLYRWTWVANDVASIENYLQYGPVVTAFTVYEDFGEYTGGVYHHTHGAVVAGHCVSIIGYDNTEQYWIVKNSWGPGWGESGYFRIGFGECNINDNVAAILQVPTVATIGLGGKIYSHYQTGQFASGDYTAVAYPPPGYAFLGWETTGSVSVDNNYYSTMAHITGDGTLKARFSEIKHPTFGSASRMSTNTYWSGFESVAAAGDYVYVAWSDNTPVPGSGSNPEVWLRTSSNNGVSFGSPIRISYNTGGSSDPAVAAAGNYVYVAWADNTPVTGSGTAPEIWMRVSSNNGGSFGSAIRISTNTGMSESPSVAAVGNYVYVAWQDNTPVSGSGSSYETWMRASSNKGTTFGAAIRMSTNTYDSVSPSLAASGSYVYVAWQDSTPVTGSGTAPEIWIRVSSNYGASFGSAIRICINTGQSAYPSVAAIGSYVYLTWEDDTPVSGSGSAAEIWLRASSNSGASFGSAIRISTNAGASVSPSVAASGSYVYVAWSDNTPVSGSGTQPEIWNRVGK